MMEDDPLDSIASLLQDDPLADLLLGGEEIEEKEEIDDDDVEERTIEEDVVERTIEDVDGLTLLDKPIVLESLTKPSKSTTTSSSSSTRSSSTPKVTVKKTHNLKEKFDRLKQEDMDENDAMSLVWKDNKGKKEWGTKSFGGRGAHYSSEGMEDIVLQNVTLGYSGRKLLNPTTLKLVHSKRYALVGDNGVGKSSLLHRIASGSLPGFPKHANVYLVEQEVLGRDDCDAIDALCGEDDSTNRYAAKSILKNLGFTDRLLSCKTSELSGGWRMRLGIASALLSAETSGIDVLMLDEPTNHLDLEGVIFLENLLSRDVSESGISSVVVVSHDEDFLRSFCTDVIVFEDQTLKYFAGDYDSYLTDLAEKRSRHNRLLDSRVREEKRVKDSIARAERQMKKKKKKGKGREKRQKQISQRKKKMERIGLYRDDGKRYKLNSLKKMDVDMARLPEKVKMLREKQALQFKFPHASDVSRGGSGTENEIVFMLKNVSVGYGTNDPILRDLSLSIRARDRIAVVGLNGCGKSTLLSAIIGKFSDSSLYVNESDDGQIWRHRLLRVAHVSQHHLDELVPYFEMSPVEYMRDVCFSNQDISKLDARSHLAKFGISGNLATREMGFLSGGERTRIVLALAVYSQPSLLVLDEPTNHLDADSLNALGSALNDWDGAIVLVSHVRSFCRAFCRDLWVIQDGSLKIHEGSEEEQPFHELLESYCEGVKRRCVIDVVDDRSVRRRAKKVIGDKNKRKKKKKGGHVRGGVERSALM